MSQSLFAIYCRYLQDLIDLLKAKDPDAEDCSSACTLQSRLVENICGTNTHGDTEQLRHNRSTIISGLDGIVMRLEGKSFSEFCGLTNQLQDVPTVLEPENLLPAHNYVTSLKEAIQEGITFLSQDETLWPDECRRLRKKFPRFSKNEIQSDNSQLFQLRVQLLHLDHETEAILNLLDEYCPACDKSGDRLRKQKQATHEKLRILLHEVERVIF